MEYLTCKAMNIIFGSSMQQHWNIRRWLNWNKKCTMTETDRWRGICRHADVHEKKKCLSKETILYLLMIIIIIMYRLACNAGCRTSSTTAQQCTFHSRLYSVRVFIFIFCCVSYVRSAASINLHPLYFVILCSASLPQNASAGSFNARNFRTCCLNSFSK